MRVDDLISLLVQYAADHGPDAQISVPRFPDPFCCGKEIYIDRSGIWSVLTSKGEEVIW